MAFLSLNEKNFIKDSLKSGLRLDGRGLLDHRNISIKFGNSYGSVEFSLGETKIQSKVISNLIEPSKDRPNEGNLAFKIDLSILNFNNQSNPIYDKDKYSNEITKILEKIIKGSKAVDVESLSILSGKSAWSIEVHLTLINNDGNIVDACYLASIISLLHFKKPHISVENMNRIVVHDDQPKKFHPLSIHHIPIAFTFAFSNDANTVFMDPLKSEEEIMEGRITFAVNIYKDICYLHKPGGAALSPKIFSSLLDVSFIKVAQVTKLIREVLKNSEEYSDLKLKQKYHVDFSKEIFNTDFIPEDSEPVNEIDEEVIIKIDELKRTIDIGDKDSDHDN